MHPVISRYLLLTVIFANIDVKITAIYTHTKFRKLQSGKLMLKHLKLELLRNPSKQQLLLLLLLLHPFNDLFFQTTWVSQYQKGKTSLDLNEVRDNHTNTSSLNFYRSDALPDAQPTVSKH